MDLQWLTIKLQVKNKYIAKYVTEVKFLQFVGKKYSQDKIQ